MSGRHQAAAGCRLGMRIRHVWRQRTASRQGALCACKATLVNERPNRLTRKRRTGSLVHSSVLSQFLFNSDQMTPSLPF